MKVYNVVLARNGSGNCLLRLGIYEEIHSLGRLGNRKTLLWLEKDAWQMSWRYSDWVLRRVWKWRSVSVAQPEIMIGGGGISNLMKLHLTDWKPKDQEICTFDSASYLESQTSGLRDGAEAVSSLLA